MLRNEVRRGAYYDSVVLMQLQRALSKLAGVEDAGAVMGAAVNKELLAQSNLLSPEAEEAGADDTPQCDQFHVPASQGAAELPRGREGGGVGRVQCELRGLLWTHSVTDGPPHRQGQRRLRSRREDPRPIHPRAP